MARARGGFDEVKEAYSWFWRKLVVVYPSTKPKEMAVRFIFYSEFKTFVNEVISTLQTGVSGIEVKSYAFNEFFGEDSPDWAKQIKEVLIDKQQIGMPFTLNNGENVYILLEGDNLVVKRLIFKHKNKLGEIYDFEPDDESDGTIRLLDLIPVFHQAIKDDAVVIIDEIEDSIHPHLLKTLISKFSKDKNTKGQLIFTTHESNLLDQEIFRQDEIWFAEKNDEGATTLYPLSDFNIRHDLDIKKGYLNGRFGAIPFMGNLKDLNWDKYAEEKPTV